MLSARSTLGTPPVRGAEGQPLKVNARTMTAARPSGLRNAAFLAVMCRIAFAGGRPIQCGGEL